MFEIKTENVELTIHVHQHHDLSQVVSKLNLILSQGEKIMATQQELTVQVKAVNEKVTKIGAETKTLLQKQNELLEIIEKGPVSPELQTAMDELVAQAQVVDDMVADAPPPTP